MADRERIVRFIREIGEISEPCEGGVQRRSWTPEFRQGMEYAKKAFKEAGLSVMEDGAGNVYGFIEGAEHPERFIFSGSHLDTVRCAGAYDGIAGVACALEAARMIKESGRPMACTFGVVGMAEEEGTTTGHCCLGSGLMTGLVREEDLDVIHEAEGDRTARQILADYGASGELHFLQGKDVRAFLELHGEQGPVLDREGPGIGVVTAITGQFWYEITVTGESNHAGTTPMSMRRDAMAAAARIMVRMDSYEREHWADDATFTAGYVAVTPNSANVVPGKVRFTTDIRSVKQEALDDMRGELMRALEEERARGLSVEVKVNAEKPPTPMDARLRGLIAAAADRTGNAYREMHSGAGHDSMVLADCFPTAMIFVPNRDGVSHNPAEYIAPEALGAGADVLYEAVRMADDEERK